MVFRVVKYLINSSKTGAGSNFGHWDFAQLITITLPLAKLAASGLSEL